MPLPWFLGVSAAAATAKGVQSGVKGVATIKDANDVMKHVENRHNNNIKRFESKSEVTNKVMDTLGELELEILSSFDNFSKVMEKIQNRPQFEAYSKDGVTLPRYDKVTLEKVSVGAGVLLGGLGGAAAGTAGAFAAAGATTSAVMALGTASTGTAIASLSGAALTNATLAALGGGAIAAGGGGIALGTTILGATTFGVGILVGGVIFNITGGKLSDKADKAYSQMIESEDKINKIHSYLINLDRTANAYIESLSKVKEKYLENFNYISYVVNSIKKTNWDEYTAEERIATENVVLLVGLLYKMCQVNIVNKAINEDDINTVNNNGINDSIINAEKVINSIA